MSITVRIAGPCDTGLFENVAADVFDDHIAPDKLAACLADPNIILCVAHCDGLLVGQVLAMIHRHPDTVTELYIDNVGVAPSHQRRGIATRMIKEAMCKGREHGCEEVWVGTEPDNAPALSLYRSLGLPSRNVIMFEGKT